MRLKKYILGHFLCLSFFSISAQNRVVDSLKQVLQTEKEDTNKVNTLNALSSKLWAISKYDTSIICSTDARKLAEKLNFKTGLAAAFSNLGMGYYYKSEYSQALGYNFNALTIEQEIGDKNGVALNLGNIGSIYDEQGNYSLALEYKLKALTISRGAGNKLFIAKALGNIGIIYDEQGNYPQALEYDLKALAIEQEIGDKRGIAINLGNLGNIYNEQGNYSQALQYDLKALPIVREIGNKYGIASTLGNLGSIYHAMGKLPQALEYNLQALTIDQEIGNKEGMADDIGNAGNIYHEMGNTLKALEYDEKALGINREIGNKEGIADVIGSIGNIYASEKNYKEAKAYLDSALALSKSIGDKDNVKAMYYTLAKLDSATGDFKTGWADYKNYVKYRDSLINEAAIKKSTQAEMNYLFSKKTDSAQAVQDKLNVLAEKENQRQRIIRNSFIGGFSIVLLAAILFFFQRKRIAKEKKRSDELLLNILPEEVAEELKEKGSTEAKTFDEVTVMFTDFKGFTTIAEKLSANELVAEIDYCFKGFDNIIHKYNIEKIKTIGDSYMAAGGLPVPNKTHAKDIINAALEIVDFMGKHKQQRTKEGKPVFEIRVGINTGHVVAGIVGVKKFAYDIWGDTVNLASRMESSGEPGKINISGSTYALVKNDFICTHRGKIQAKNKGEVDMYFVERKSE